MPTSIYKSLNCGDLEPTGMTIQLANRSVVQPLGVLEDVLVQVDELIFPADFYVLDMKDETLGKGSTLILGRPFQMTTRTKIDVHAGTLSMEFGDTLVQFNIFEAMKHPMEDTSLFGIDLIDELVKEHMQANTGSIEFFQVVGNTDHKEQLEARIMPATQLPDSNQVDQIVSRPISEVSPPKPPTKLKSLPNHLMYAYLGDEQQFPIIIANNLHQEQEEKLLQVLKQHKKAIGWKLSDLPGINPSICMHRILMEEEARPIRTQLNPTILDVVKKEVTKLLVAGIIYPISNRSWYQHGVQNNLRVRIDDRKLNKATRKDHFPLPFLDQVLEKLVGKFYYYFLDGYLMSHRSYTIGGPKSVNKQLTHSKDDCATKSLSHPKKAQRIRPASKQSSSIRNEVQVAFHVNHSKATLVPAQQPCHSRVAAMQVTARLGTEKPKVTKGDRLVYQRTLVDLILSVLANGGGPSPSTMTIIVEDGVTESRPC
ncbi:hypothetical protein CR513_49611, partial [Mucuna pruriens]